MKNKASKKWTAERRLRQQQTLLRKNGQRMVNGVVGTIDVTLPAGAPECPSFSHFIGRLQTIQGHQDFTPEQKASLLSDMYGVLFGFDKDTETKTTEG